MNMLTAALVRNAIQPARTPAPSTKPPASENVADGYSGPVAQAPAAKRNARVSTALGFTAGAALGATADLVGTALGHSIGSPVAVIVGAAFIFSGSVTVYNRSLTDVLTPFKPAEGDSEKTRTAKTIGNYAVRLGGGAAIMAAGLFAPTVAAGAIGFGVAGAIIGNILHRAET